MSTKVAKFGGSSVADDIQIRKIKSIVSADPARRFVVVSAPGKRYSTDNKITDLLYLCKEHVDKHVTYEQVLQVIHDRYIAIESNLEVDAGIAKEFTIISQNLEEGTTSDYIASRGEYLNAKIIAAFLGFDFIDAATFVKFDARGRFLFEETNDALAIELAKHENGVIPGFYGTTPDGKIKTFTRGGSDITGALVARATDAEVYENWTDVSGFLMADPRIVDNPKGIDEITYKELRELSYMGASVLHENAVYPARLAGIPINIRNTNKPEDKGTIIVDEGQAKEGGIITGIAGNKDYTVIAFYKNMMSTEIGFIRRVLSILEEYQVPVEHMPSGIDTLSVVIASKYLEDKLSDILEDFERKLAPDTIDVIENVSLIATVGRGMASKHGVASKLFKALFDADINIRMIDQGSSEINIIVGVNSTDFGQAIQAIYAAFAATN
ncbi:MAG: aspartate kinase [Clostridiales Family XIII bacterium]|nr:aspartate kinase [Clostridiales Family XIII bacterium]